MTCQKRLAAGPEVCHLGILISEAETTPFNMDVIKANITVIKNINPHQGKIPIAASEMT